VALLEKWNRRINLIGRSTLGEIWTRHIEDSLQVYRAAGRPGDWADLGTGAGLPGLVIAILAHEETPENKVTLVESDQRKAEFCRAVIRTLGLTATVRSERIESTFPINADMLCARALAPLDVLLGYAKRHMKQGGLAIFPKGAGWQQEVEAAARNWRFRLDRVASSTDSAAVILKIGDIERV